MLKWLSHPCISLLGKDISCVYIRVLAESQAESTVYNNYTQTQRRFTSTFSIACGSFTEQLAQSEGFQCCSTIKVDSISNVFVPSLSRYSSLAVPSTISLALWVPGLVSLIVQRVLRVTVRDESLWLIRTITVCRYENPLRRNQHVSDVNTQLLVLTLSLLQM